MSRRNLTRNEKLHVVVNDFLFSQKIHKESAQTSPKGTQTQDITIQKRGRIETEKARQLSYNTQEEGFRCTLHMCAETESCANNVLTYLGCPE